MENNKPEQLNRKQMEELLPDYIFGRLETGDSLRFENSLPSYPDLIDEIKTVRKVFDEVEKMDFNKKIEHRARNLSVQVLKKKYETTSKSRLTKGKVYRTAIPIMAVIAMAFVYFQNFEKNDNPAPQAARQMILKESDVSSLVDSSVTPSEIINATLDSEPVDPPVHELAKTDDDVNELDQLIADEISNTAGSTVTENLANSDITTVNTLIDEFAQYNEADLQLLIEDLSNVSIKDY